MPVPPTVPTSFVTDAGTAIPAANVLNDITNLQTGNFVNGIRTTGSGNTVTTVLTNRITGSTTTSDGAGQTKTFATFSLGSTPGTYVFDVNIVAFNVTDSLGAGYKVFLTRRTTGLADVGIGPDSFVEKEEGAMSGVVVTVLTSSNNFQIEVTGLAGKVIDWNAVATYVFVS